MKEYLTFDDVLIAPRFSSVNSRSEVNLSGKWLKDDLFIDSWTLPVMSANMDTVTGRIMANVMDFCGGLACLHRFWSIQENVLAFMLAPKAWVSIGLGENEFDRAKALYAAGARKFILDVAHGAQAQVGQQYVKLKKTYPETFVVVGNFATPQSITGLWIYINNELNGNVGIDGVKIGIGPGSACTTRIKTGCGIPQLSAIQEIAQNYQGLIIADGGCRTPGDVAKALAAGADLVMLGGMLAGTEETPGDIVDGLKPDWSQKYKQYRGSASKESYEAQGKDQKYIATEGESFTVPYKGSVQEILQDIEGGLRSALTYVGARNLREFRERAEFIRVSASTVRENGAHGKVS